jgi:hypothetical protein
LFAAEARKAVILRRGPREHFHLIAWDLKTDTFARGQWLRGRVRLCDLSPDGSRLLYWAGQYHRPGTRPSASCYYEPEPPAVAPRRGGRKAPRYVREQETPVLVERPAESFSTWTAVSKPPFFTALAIWPSLGTWTGGGCFGEDGAICLAEFGLEPIANAGPPDVPVRAIPIRSEFKRSARFGDVDGDPMQADVALALSAAGAQRVHWVDLTAPTGVTFAYDGRVFRGRAAAAPEDIALSGALIADFTELAFEHIPPPPSALRW